MNCFVPGHPKSQLPYIPFPHLSDGSLTHKLAHSALPSSCDLTGAWTSLLHLLQQMATQPEVWQESLPRLLIWVIAGGEVLLLGLKDLTMKGEQAACTGLWVEEPARGVEKGNMWHLWCHAYDLGQPGMKWFASIASCRTSEPTWQCVAAAAAAAVLIIIDFI